MVSERGAHHPEHDPGVVEQTLFFNVLEDHKKSRYPRAAHTGATLYHYGWVRSEAADEFKKSATTLKFWQNRTTNEVDYTKIDPEILRPFTGTHPQIVRDWLPKAEGVFRADPNHQLTTREKKHRRMMKLEKFSAFNSAGNITGW